MLPAREGEPEVVEHVLERPAGKGHREAIGMGEVGQRLATGRMLLPEDQLALGTLGRPPMGDVALESAAADPGNGPDAAAAVLQAGSWRECPAPAPGSARSRRATRPGRDRPGSGHRRGSRWLASMRRPFSMRRAVLSLKPARADAIAWLDLLALVHEPLTWRSVMCPPGIRSPRAGGGRIGQLPDRSS